MPASTIGPMQLQKDAPFTLSFPVLNSSNNLAVGLNVSNFTIVLSKNGAAGTSISPTVSEVSGSTGVYSFTLTDTQLDTEGLSTVKITHSGAGEPVVVLLHVDNLVRVSTPGRVMDVNATGGIEVGTFQTAAIMALLQEPISNHETADVPCLAQALGKLLHQTDFRNGLLNVRLSDDQGIWFSQAVTFNDAAQPITEVRRAQ